MNVDITLAAFVALSGLFVVLGGKVWGLAAKVEGSATRDELNARETALRKEFEASIKDKSKESQDEHRVFAHKSGVVKIENQMFDIERETSLRFDAFRKEVNDRFDEVNKKDDKILDLVTKINFRVTPKGEQL